MKTLVMKFGGAAVASSGQFSKIADLILTRSLSYPKIVVVLSAMSGMTDHLLGLARQVNPDPPKREQDMLISVGERISISLLAMALAAKNREAISFTGSQSGIITSSSHSDAKIIDVRPVRLLPHLEAGKIVIVAGFQGVSRQGEITEITTLGRGGSDTTAVALAVALDAELEFYKDVPGIFDSDPRVNPDARFYPKLSYQEALEIVERGAKVLHARCIRLAEKNGIAFRVRSFLENDAAIDNGTLIGGSVKSAPSSFMYEVE